MHTVIRSFLKSAMVLVSTVCVCACHTDGVLNPKGPVALQERHLLILSVALMLIVVIPVIFMDLWFAYRYRASNTKAIYRPDWSQNVILELVLWLIPCVIIAFLAVVTWRDTHRLDPFNPVDPKKKPLEIQVIALNWKWLFVYPEQGIATINWMEIPRGVPIHLHITADAPMNSFNIPILSGQIYAMAGMETQLYFRADELGTFSGASTNFSGNGFSWMNFRVQVDSQSEFEHWVHKIHFAGMPKLSMELYQHLVPDSINDAVTYFSQIDPHLFHSIIMKYMDMGYVDVHHMSKAHSGCLHAHKAE